MLEVRWVMTFLCAVGFYASVFMLRKTARAARGELDEPSVVQTPRARLFGGVPNALFGFCYYPAAAAAAWFVHGAPLFAAAGAAAAAALTSAYLAYSLLFVTKRSCPYCWSAHVANWLLFAGMLLLIVLKA